MKCCEHQRSGRLDDAEDIYRRIISDDPDQAGILNNLANVLKDSGRIEEAVDICREALPGARQCGDSQQPLLQAAFSSGIRSRGLFRECREWDRRHGDAAGTQRSLAGRRLRIGYVSPDFYGHAECFFVLPLLEAHDRQQFRDALLFQRPAGRTGDRDLRTAPKCGIMCECRTINWRRRSARTGSISWSI